MRCCALMILVILAGLAALVSPSANAGGCGPVVPGYVQPTSCWSPAPAAAFYPAPLPATVECEVRDLVNQGQFYSTEPLVTRRFCRASCPPPPMPEVVSVVPACWR